MKKVLLLIAATCTLSGVSMAHTSPLHPTKVISVLDFGAKPNDGKDDTKALRKAAQYCRDNQGTTLEMPAGIYQLRDTKAEKLEKDVLSGKMGPNPEETIFTPYYPYVSGLDFSGSKDITIHANGAILLCEGWMEPISLIDCINFTLEGLTIDYKRKPFSEGRVTEIADDSFTVQFGSEHKITNEIHIPRLMLWDNQIGGIYRSPFYFPKRELKGNNLVQFKGKLPQYMKGAAIAAPHSFHFRPGILILRSTNTHLEGVTIHAQCGMGIVGFDSRDIYIRNLEVIPADGYTFSTNTDATHFACCEGVLSFDGCMFRGQGDDATNVHGYYHDITSVEKDMVTLVLKAPTFTHAQVADVPRVGDKMEIVHIATLTVRGEAEVTEVIHEAPATEVRVRLKGKLPENYQEYYLFNTSKLPQLEFRRSMVWGNLARGVLVKTRNVKIEDNIFRGCTGTAIHVGAESNWKEGTHTKNLTISNNVIVNCGLGAGRQYGASGIAVVIGAPDLKDTTLHDGVTISGNTIIGTGENDCGIAIYNTRNILLDNNHIKGCKQGIATQSVENLTIK